MKDNDIRELFYKKNKEIIINKLLLDLDNNIDSLIATMDNIIYLEFGIYKEKIVNIDNEKTKEIYKILNGYEECLKEKLKKEVSFKKDKCSTYLKGSFLDNKVFKYKEMLDSTTKYIEEMLPEVIDDLLTKKVKNKLPKDWYYKNKEKTNFFLDEKLSSDIVSKLLLQLRDRDTIIYNNAQESYQKYLSLNDNIR